MMGWNQSTFYSPLSTFSRSVPRSSDLCTTSTPLLPLRALLFPLPRYAGGGRGWGLQCLTVLLMCSSIALAQRCTQIKSLSISNGRYSSIPLFVAVHFSGDKNLDEIAKGSTKTVGALASRQCT